MARMLGRMEDAVMVPSHTSPKRARGMLRSLAHASGWSGSVFQVIGIVQVIVSTLPNEDGGGVTGQTFLVGQHTHIVRHTPETLRCERQHAGAMQKVVRRQAAGETSSPAGGQHMRGTGDIIAESD